MYRFALDENKLRKPTVDEGWSDFSAILIGKEGNDSFCLIFIFLIICMSHRSSEGSFGIVGETPF